MKTNMPGSLRGLFAALSIAVSCSIAIPAGAPADFRPLIAQLREHCNACHAVNMKAD
jgi:hypothetical protein